jgi:hypothetical protein
MAFPLGAPLPSPFDISRVKDYPDKRLLKYLQAYYKTFTDPNPEAMREFQTEDFTITDIRKNIFSVPLS